MYASKRRQRNFKRVRECVKSGAPTNPSKRHRERLNGELETVASLLPFDDVTLQRLDKLSVLRLAVSFLQIKAHFHVCTSQFQNIGKCASHPLATSTSLLVSPIPVPSFVDPSTGFPLIDPLEPLFSHVALKALGGFLIILNEHGDIYYVSENIEHYLGFLQSDILHQPIFDMIHSEDRDEIRTSLQLVSAPNSLKSRLLENDELAERAVIARFRCLLDNTCGFIRVEIRGRFTELHSANQTLSQQPLPQRFGLLAICTPFVPPMDMLTEDPILKTKHSLDMTILCSDIRFKQILEIEQAQTISFYDLIHPSDVRYVSEAHSAVIKNTSAGLMIYRLLSQKSGSICYVQTSLRVFFKNSKAESIGGTHRVLTEIDGLALLDKRTNMKSKFLTFDDTLLQSPRILNPTQQSYPLKHHRESNPSSSSNSMSNSMSMPELKTSANMEANISKLQQVLPSHHPSTSVLPPQLHPQQAFNSAQPFFQAPLFPLQLPDQLPAEMNGLFSNYFPANHMSAEAESLWMAQGFKRPLEIYSDSFASAYYPSSQFEPYDYNGQPPGWTHEEPMASSSAEQSTSDYGQGMKFNEMGQSSSTTKPNSLPNSLPTNLLPQPAVYVEDSRYYNPLSSSIFPPTDQQFGQLEMVPASNNFTFLSEVTQTLLGNQCQ